eukprot:tig00000681_g3071.t1
MTTNIVLWSAAPEPVALGGTLLARPPISAMVPARDEEATFLRSETNINTMGYQQAPGETFNQRAFPISPIIPSVANPVRAAEPIPDNVYVGPCEMAMAPNWPQTARFGPYTCGERPPPMYRYN